MQLGPNELKDLAVYNSFLAMQANLQRAQSQMQVDMLAKRVHELQEADKARQADFEAALKRMTPPADEAPVEVDGPISPPGWSPAELAKVPAAG
jgi:hypothetical protein